MYYSYTYYIYYKEANVYISSQEGRTNVICILGDISNVFVHTETDNGVRLNTNFDNKRDDLTFPIVNFPFISINISSSITIEWSLHFTTRTLF
jgi:hypothetical protein